MTPGDFVRTVRQMIDLLRQLETVASEPGDASAAAEAVVLLNRGVIQAVAGGSA